MSSMLFRQGPRFYGRGFYGQVRKMSLPAEMLVAFHDISLIPWWALIPLTTFTLRTVWTFPLALWQRKRLQRQNLFRPIVSGMNPILKLKLGDRVMKYRSGPRSKGPGSIGPGPESIGPESSGPGSSDPTHPLASMSYEQIVLLAAKECRKRQKALFKSHDISLWKNLLLPAFQIPLWVAMSLTMRQVSGWMSWNSIANKPMSPSLAQEGFGWIQDLSTFDHWHITPVVLGIVSLCNVEWTAAALAGARARVSMSLRPTFADAMVNVGKMSVVFMMVVAINAPSAVCLYWISSQVYSLIQNVVLDKAYPLQYRPQLNTGRKASEEGILLIRGT